MIWKTTSDNNRCEDSQPESAAEGLKKREQLFEECLVNDLWRLKEGMHQISLMLHIFIERTGVSLTAAINIGDSSTMPSM